MGLVHHCDRGSQYLSIKYSERLAEAGIEPSAGSAGDSYDNALAETINGLFKAEVIHRRGPWRTFKAVEFATLEWVDRFNNRRLLEPIGNMPPAEAGQNFYKTLEQHDMAAWLKPNSLRKIRGGSARCRDRDPRRVLPCPRSGYEPGRRNNQHPNRWRGSDHSQAGLRTVRSRNPSTNRHTLSSWTR